MHLLVTENDASTALLINDVWHMESRVTMSSALCGDGIEQTHSQGYV